MLRQIKNFPLYAISSKDNLVLNIKTGRVLKPTKLRNGYLKVYLSNKGKQKNCYIHQLVAEAFIDNPNNLPCVNHIDGNKLNNDLYNLERCTYSENITHAYNTGLKKSVKNCPKVSKPVIGTSLCGTVFKYFSSIKESGRNGFSRSAVSMCCSGKLEQHKGYVWKYF